MKIEEPKGWGWPESQAHETPCRTRIAPEVWGSTRLGAHLLRVPNESMEARSRGAFGLPLE